MKRSRIVLAAAAVVVLIFGGATLVLANPVGSLGTEPDAAPDLAEEPAPDWETLIGPDAPDAVSASPADTDTTDWSTLHYAFVPGLAFHPRWQTTGRTYAGEGCISAVNNTEFMVAYLDLPSGCRIDYLRYFYYDAVAHTSRAYLVTYDGVGGHADLVTVASADATGYGSSLSDNLGHVVNTYNNGYLLIWSPGVTGTDMRLCGVRVAYVLPD